MIANQTPFSLGKIVATPGALAALATAGEDAKTYLNRHARGDWGILGENDWELNDLALEQGDRILSAYNLKSGQRLWIITEADRSSTCVLLPDEY